MVAKKRSIGTIKACHIHDLLRELCLKKAEEDNFFVKIYKDDPFSPSTSHKHHRLFIGRQFFHKFSSTPCARNLRSFLCFSLPNSSHFEQNLSFFVENFELLRVLNFTTATSLGEIGIGDLVHLRYLALLLPEVKRFYAPNFFHYLSNLEILNIECLWSKIILPRDILKMVKLRHLYTKQGAFKYHFSDDEEEGNMLDSLQSLHRLCICEHCLHFLERTPNLRKLGLRGFPDVEGIDVVMLPDLKYLKCLEILNVQGWHETTRVVSTGLKLPPTLTRLTLSQMNLKWEELSKILQTLPSLEVLKLYNACSGPVWNTSELGEEFSQLKYLKFFNLDIKEWNATEDQFLRLEVLDIGSCIYLERIPIEFGNLYELREIKLERCNRSVEESAREIQEEQRNRKGDDGCLNLLTRDNDYKRQ